LKANILNNPITTTRSNMPLIIDVRVQRVKVRQRTLYYRLRMHIQRLHMIPKMKLTSKT